MCACVGEELPLEKLLPRNVAPGQFRLEVVFEEGTVAPQIGKHKQDPRKGSQACDQQEIRELQAARTFFL